MATPGGYDTGTATIALAAPKRVIGQNTLWAAAGIRPGEIFAAAGLSVRIAAVVSNTELELAENWPGAARTAAPYDIRLVSDLDRVRGVAMDLVEKLGKSALAAIGDLTPAAGRIARYSGAQTAEMIALSSKAADLLAAADPAAMRALLETGGTRGGFKNYLINGDMAVNQRAFAGGDVLQNQYAYDRWKATTAATASLSAAGGLITLNGEVGQIIEAPRLAGRQVTVSVEDPSASFPVSVAASGSGSGVASGNIPAGAGRRGVTLVVPETATGNVVVRLRPTSQVTFRRVQMEDGPVATEWDSWPVRLQELLCRQYFERIDGAIETLIATGFMASATSSVSKIDFAPKRIRPAISQSGGSYQLMKTGGFLGNIPPSDVSFFQIGTASARLTVAAPGLTPGQAGALNIIAPAIIDISAEL